MSGHNLFSQLMSYFYRYSTCFNVFIPRPVTTSFLRFFAVPVRGSCILKLSGTSPVCGPSKKGNRTKTGPDFKALIDLDCSSQENVPYHVKTAYRFTDSFTVNGVTKQGGSLSPLKCTLTTSLCNRWLADRRMDFSGSIFITSHLHRLHRIHTPLDRIQLHLSMIEAMDDSLIPSSDLHSLKLMAWDADRFQATYGWETAWPKSALYVYNTTPPSSLDAHMPSVDYSNPQFDSLTWHEIPIITTHTTFLRVPINKPDLQFSLLCDLILNFSFLTSTHCLPLTVLRQIVVQHLISKICPHLALQPISH